MAFSKARRNARKMEDSASFETNSLLNLNPLRNRPTSSKGGGWSMFNLPPLASGDPWGSGCRLEATEVSKASNEVPDDFSLRLPIRVKCNFDVIQAIIWLNAGPHRKSPGLWPIGSLIIMDQWANPLQSGKQAFRCQKITRQTSYYCHQESTHPARGKAVHPLGDNLSSWSHPRRSA